jgi:hypothetical protein
LPENLSYQKPSKSILELLESTSRIDGYKKEYLLLTYRNTYKSLDDLNQDELVLEAMNQSCD